jgi:hypothetical protein
MAIAQVHRNERRAAPRIVYGYNACPYVVVWGQIDDVFGSGPDKKDVFPLIAA